MDRLSLELSKLGDVARAEVLDDSQQAPLLISAERANIWDDMPGFYPAPAPAISDASALAAQGRVVRVVDSDGGIVWSSA